MCSCGVKQEILKLYSCVLYLFELGIADL